MSAVHAFLKFLGADYAGLYQIEGRGIPDISALAESFVYIRNNAMKFTSSTSCSMSVVAGMVSLLNDYLLSNGWTPIGSWIGFFNLLLYSYRFEGVNDVILGSNLGYHTEGFPATIGWDPATGVGTPVFDKLLRLLPQLAPPSSSASALPPASHSASRDIGGDLTNEFEQAAVVYVACHLDSHIPNLLH